MTPLGEDKWSITTETLEAKIRTYAAALGEHLVAELRLLGVTTSPEVREVTAEAIYRLLSYIEAFRAYRYAETAFLTPSAIHPAIEERAQQAIKAMYAKVDEACEAEEELLLSKLIHKALLADSTVRMHRLEEKD